MTIKEEYEILWAVYQSIQERGKKHLKYFRADISFTDKAVYDLVTKTLLSDIIKPIEAEQ